MPIFKSHSITRGHAQKYSREICKYSPRHNFLTNRIVNEWNTLSREVIESKDVNEFKNKLDKEFK